MKALYYDKSLQYVENYPKPSPKSGESLVEIIVSAICNTDKEILKGYRPDFKGILGHEFVGKVLESDDPSLIGHRVVGEINENCGHCIYCKTGRPTHCENRKVVGISGKDGCFAQYITIRNELLHIVPKEVPSEVAIFTEPLAAALEILEQVHIKPSTSVGIIGDGRLAYMIAQVVSLTGANLTIIGKHEEKLNLFKSFAKVRTNTEESYEIVIDASGSPSGILTAQKIVRKKGTIVIKTTYAGKVEIDMSDFVVNEITIKGSRCGPFEPALQLLKLGLIQFPPIDLYELEDYEKAFESREFKVGFRF
ncbi:alcohol dehydrogenase catalytic domain-containing protein [Tissierella sp.]|uniref:MDR/zinc-dependent alcohol dehydrogenase-like family protein n=1 Tax=Tissierella sp. TaxID=41274 RepID=UPI00285B276D|nr:alcohol dehydrogenase catalytic domain-containing protein [Tissierella sp.]MDR7856794.1 alcohol dehydrogenase catalytic domain-containing protein [Tissierella sp.]